MLLGPPPLANRRDGVERHATLLLKPATCAIVRAMSILTNASSIVRDRLARLFPFAYTTKHDHAADFGWPSEICFQQYFRMYCRNSLASAAVDKTIAKTWQTHPEIWQSEKPSESPLEIAAREHFTARNIWRAFMQTDRRGMVGAYAGAIILVRDGRPLDQPVERLRSIEDVVAIIPAWEGQLQVAEWDGDPFSETYGEPLFYQFDEQAVGGVAVAKRQLRLHPSRVLIWSEDGTVNGRSDLEPGFNDLIDAEKIKGAGGEGFWKSSRGAPIIQAPTGLSAADARDMMGARTNTEALEKLNEQVDDFQSGFDKALMLGGFQVEPLTITLPQPKEFWETAVQGFAASMGIPFKELIGNITGERASTEDARAWSQTCMSRRENIVLPALNEFLRRLIAWGALPQGCVIGWASLLDATPDEMLDRGVKMANIQSTFGQELVYLPDEVREVTGFAPSDEIAGWDEYQAEKDAAAEDVAASMAQDNTGNQV